MTTQKGPVIVITGTPGTGKSTHAQLLASESPIPLKHINVGDWVKEKRLYEEFDDQWQSYNVDEDKVRPHRVSWTYHDPHDVIAPGRAGISRYRGRNYS